MTKIGEPRSTNFLLLNSPLNNPENTIVRSGEAHQSKKLSGDFNYRRIKQFAGRMKYIPI